MSFYVYLSSAPDFFVNDLNEREQKRTSAVRNGLICDIVSCFERRMDESEREIIEFMFTNKESKKRERESEHKSVLKFRN